MSRRFRQRFPGLPECLQPVANRLARNGSTGWLVVPEDQSGRPVQPRDERAGKHGEGVMIASPGSLHELSLVHGHPL